MQGKPSGLKVGLLLLWVSSKDSLQKSRCQFLHFCSFHFRTRILCKSGDDRGPGRPLAGYIFCILAQGFSSKVAMTGKLDDRCSDALFAFSHRDSLQKSRSKFSSKHDALSWCLYNMLLPPKDFHTFYKTSHVRIIMTVIVAARVLILVQGFSSKVEWTAKMNHVSIKVTALDFIKSLLLPTE